MIKFPAESEGVKLIVKGLIKLVEEEGISPFDAILVATYAGSKSLEHLKAIEKKGVKS
ncbi:hypothetical protein [Bacillus cereus]|uniref:hypothetical protein n=1 Tax=Bacillus cereus TaxID=1396 RepID=UPI001596BAD5|nr:hypothetical protein [Bacillus cereus]